MALYRNIAGPNTIGQTSEFEQDLRDLYDWMLASSPDLVALKAFKINPVDGNIYRMDHVMLPLDFIQRIETERGTLGALFTHLQEPYLANKFFRASQLPIETTLPTTTTPAPSDTTPSEQVPGTTTTPTTDLKTSLQTNLLPLAAVAGFVTASVFGDQLRAKNLIMAGSLGVLFYSLAKKPTS